MVRIWKVYVLKNGMYQDLEYFLSRSDAYRYALRICDADARRRVRVYERVYVSMFEVELSGSRSYPTRIF